MKKRIIILSLIFILSMPTFSLAKTEGIKARSSSGKTEAVKYINKFIDNTSLISEVDLTTALKAMIKMKGQKPQKVKSLVRVKMKKGHGAEIDISKVAVSIVGTTEFGEQKAKTGIYIKDGYIYQNIMGAKTKKPLEAEPEKLMMTSQYKGFDIKSSWLKSAKVKKYNRGRNVAITAEVNLKNVQNFIKKDPNLKNLLERDDKIELSSVKKLLIGYYIKNNVPYQSSMYIEVKDTDISGSGFIKVNYNKINNIGDISYPPDLGSYRLEGE